MGQVGVLTIYLLSPAENTDSWPISQNPQNPCADSPYPHGSQQQGRGRDHWHGSKLGIIMQGSMETSWQQEHKSKFILWKYGTSSIKSMKVKL